ncbi:MAG: response regulator transcription factor [Clostridia bacterium]|nr:response regulator transcription factor [Clostridia bacterium]
MATILVIEDDPHVGALLRLTLEREGFAVRCAATGPEGLAAFRQAPPDLVILDLMLPGASGWEVCRRVRAESDVPVLILTARTSEDDEVQGLDLGADDYVRKPFSPRQLAARVRALLRRARPRVASTLTFPGLRIEPDTLRALVEGRPVALAPREMELLVFLARHEGRAFSRQELLNRVWGVDYDGEASTVDEHVRRLRRKIEGNGGRRFIHTVWGVGYRFAVEAEGGTEP